MDRRNADAKHTSLHVVRVQMWIFMPYQKKVKYYSPCEAHRPQGYSFCIYSIHVFISFLSQHRQTQQPLRNLWLCVGVCVSSLTMTALLTEISTHLMAPLVLRLKTSKHKSTLKCSLLLNPIWVTSSHIRNNQVSNLHLSVNRCSVELLHQQHTVIRGWILKQEMENQKNYFLNIINICFIFTLSTFSCRVSHTVLGTSFFSLTLSVIIL